MSENKIREMIFDAVCDIIVKIQDENEITDGCEPFDTKLDDLIDDLKTEIVRTIEYQLMCKHLNEREENEE